MCLACDEMEMYRRYLLLQQIAKGEMPEGYGAEDLIAMGLPLPGEVVATQEPDGTIIYRQLPPKKREKTGTDAAKTFVCDTPDDE
jgi:hypothetical protein